MLIGCYYRCPVPVEEGDYDHPRFFVLAQAMEYNELADAVRVQMHDLLGGGRCYSEIMQNNVFRADDITRCEASPGSEAEGNWGCGTIVVRAREPFAENKPYWYWVKLPDGRHRKLCETEMRIEFSKMNYSPKQQLRAYEFQNPTWFINHLKVSRNRHLINHAPYGFRELAGCRAYLMPHQVNTVARCFETMPIRYMLADEVGLGKTVEACSILRILASENQNLRTLIVVPEALLSQWENELHYKYGMSSAVASRTAKLCMLPMESLEKSQSILQEPWDLAIVDETHRLLSHDEWYARIASLSRRVEHILLLSATPIQDRNEEYRRLLALLSPEQYANMTKERFSWMVKKQKRIQKKVNQQLGRLDRYEDYNEIILEALEEIGEILEDRGLNKLIKLIDLNADDKGLESVRQALAYLCENYRLERRVIRNRRQLLSEQMARRTLTQIPYSPLSANENYNETGVIQNTLAYLSENGEDDEEYVEKVGIPLLSALFSSPWAFDETLNRLQIQDGILRNGAAEWKRQAEQEHRSANYFLDEEPDEIKGRLLKAMDFIDQETDLVDSDNCKIVVFTAFQGTMDAFTRLFNSRYGQKGIRAVTFSKGMIRTDLENSVYAFQNDPMCRMIICDETGGEGRNFQNAQMVIHLDLPWNANALEQRIGRLDRIGRDPEMDVRSVVLYASGTVEEQLFRIWRDGMKLFEQSLSGLEIITGELNGLITEALLDDYHTGLSHAFDDILNQAEEMRESVEDEQDFDLGATLYRPLFQGVDHVLEMYAQDDDSLFASAMMSWGQQAGMHAERGGEPGLVEFRESAFSVNAARQSLFVPPQWSRYAQSSIMRRERRILGTFDRTIAAQREDLLFFAPGDPVYESIISNAVGCSRGRCAAIETIGDYTYDGLVFIYNVDPVLDDLLTEKMGLQILAQYRMYLPLEQIMVTIPLTSDSRIVSEEQVLKTVDSLNWRNSQHLGRRSAGRLAMAPIDRFIARTPESKWEPLIDKCSEAAYRKAFRKMREASDLDTARKEMHRVMNGFRAEYAFFERQDSSLQEKDRIFRMTWKALCDARPVLDSVCFLRVRKDG